MRNFKRFLTLALAVLMVVSVFAFNTSAATFTDVDEDNEYLAQSVSLLSYLGVTKGTSETTFGTDDAVTREQMAAFIYRLMKKGNSVEGGENTSVFTDLEDPTFFFMVSWAASQDIIKGTSATTFNPKGGITLQDAYVMLVRALGYEKDGALAYPFGYIDVAEKKGVALDEGLRSDLTYTTPLTRGDVAVLLYNTFFAETAPVTKLSYNKVTEVFETVSTSEIFCEEYFDVEEREYQVVATPNYVLAEKANETTKEFGDDILQFEVTEDEVNDGAVESIFYYSAADLGLENADDYIMSYFKMYVVEDDDEIEEILFAESLMDVVTTSDLNFASVTTTTKDSYYGNNTTAARVKKLSGKVTFDGNTAYFFNAPYAFLAPSYAKDATAEEKYDARNANNLKSIDFTVLGDVEDGEYTVTLGGDLYTATDIEDFTAEATDLYKDFAQAILGGLYEADLYDIDGDGKFDYINYKPYDWAIVDTEEDEEGRFEENVLYTEGLVLEGEKVADEDFVIGYFDNDSNYAKVAAVVAPTEAKVTNLADNGKDVELGDKVVNVSNGWYLFASNLTADVLDDLAAADFIVGKKDGQYNAVDAYKYAGLLEATVLDSDEAEYYIYNDTIVYTDVVTASTEFSGDYLIVATKEGRDLYIKGEINRETGDRAYYASAYLNGKLAYIEIDPESEIFTAEGTLLIDEAEALLGEEESEFAYTIAEYTVNSLGQYDLKLVGNAYDEDEEYISIPAGEDVDYSKENDKADAGYFTADALYFSKISANRFRLAEDLGKTTASELGFDLTITDKTEVIIKSWDADEEEVVYTTLKQADLVESIETALSNIVLVVENNPDATRYEKLLVLYAELRDGNGDLVELDFAGTKTNKAERIVTKADVKMNAEGEFYVLYNVLNPYTGKTETGIASADSWKKATTASSNKIAVGNWVELESGKVANEVETFDAVIKSNNVGYYWIEEFDATSNLAYAREITGADATTGDLMIFNLEDAQVSKLGNQTHNLNNEMFGSFTSIAAEKLDGSDKDMLAVNTNYYEDEEDEKPSTVYGQFVKAYIAFDADKDYDEDEGYYTPAFVIVIANDGEADAFCELD